MAVTGDIWGSSATSDSTVGQKAWSSISNFEGNTTSTEMSFSGALAQVNSYYVKTTHVHGLSTGDTITNIAVAIERRCDNTDDYAKDTYVQLIVNGTIQATNKGFITVNWPTTKGWSATYASPPSGWGYGSTLTGADTLGIAFAAYCGGKHSSMWASRITMVITYTAASGTAYTMTITSATYTLTLYDAVLAYATGILSSAFNIFKKRRR